MHGEYISIVISTAALAISAASAYFARRSWYQTYRPVVTAFIAEDDGGTSATAYNLVVSNTGNRPATDVRIEASPKDIQKLVMPEAEKSRREEAYRCFRPESTIPVLRDGEEMKTALGAYTSNSANGPWLNYGAEIQINVLYKDLSGRRYKSTMPIKIIARDGFGGSFWAEST